MPLESLKVGSGAATSLPTPQATEDTAATQKSGAATFFKAIGKKMASVAKSIGDGISSLAPKHKPSSESLSPGAKAAYANFREISKKVDKLEKLANPTPAQQAKLQQAKDDLKTARQEAVQHLKQQFLNGQFYAAAQNEPNKQIFSSKDYFSNNPSGDLASAMNYILAKDAKVDKILNSGMKIDQAVAIFVYTQGAYSGINKELRSGTPSPFIQELAANVTAGLAKLPPFEEPVYRVVSLPDSIDRQYQEGATVADKGLLSTTYNVDFDFLGGGTSHVLSIVGHGESAGRDVSWLSESPGEKEVLFPPGTEFIVKQRDQAETPKVIGQNPDGTNKYDSQVGVLLVQKPK